MHQKCIICIFNSTFCTMSLEYNWYIFSYYITKTQNVHMLCQLVRNCVRKSIVMRFIWNIIQKTGTLKCVFPAQTFKQYGKFETVWKLFKQKVTILVHLSCVHCKQYAVLLTPTSLTLSLPSFAYLCLAKY